MRNNISVVVVLSIAVLAFAPMCFGQSPLPAADLSMVATVIMRDFASIDEIYTVGMTDDPGGKFDIVVVGSRPKENGWRVEAISINHHRVRTKWDSAVSVREPEFQSAGQKSIQVHVKNYDYDVLIQGCVARECGDGIDGFLLFSGKTGKASKAKVVTQGLDKPGAEPPKYDVTFSAGIDKSSEQMLKDAICGCSSTTISNKAGLPFPCKAP